MLKLLRYTVVIAILVGSYLSLPANARLRRLQKEQISLNDQVQPLEVGDPNRIHISAFDVEFDPSGIDNGLVGLWNFRTYIPANCKTIEVCRSGTISANSPLANSRGSSSYSSGPTKEPIHDLLTISLEKNETGWRLNQISNSTSGSKSFAVETTIKDLDGFVLEPVVRPDDGSKSFALDEPICLFRARSRIPEAKDAGKSNQPLYQGVYFYLVPEQAQDKFEEQSRGVSE